MVRLDSLYCRAVHLAMVVGLRILTALYSPPLSIICAKIDRSCAVEKSPAWPATPPIAHAFSSWTIPRRSPPRAVSISAGAMRQQLAHGDRRLFGRIELRKVGRNGAIDVELPALFENHGGCSGRNDFRQRCHVVHGVLIHTSGCRIIPVQATVAARVSDMPVPSDSDRGSGRRAAHERG